MSLSPSTRLGPYEIVSAIGAGGMGEVYRARDTRLNRDVAVKVLPDLFAADPERLARFEREAQVLASLNHPNIAHVYGVEDLPPKGGSHATAGLVMELVEGEDLAQRLARGPIPVDEALAIARQIADALEAAHELGIVHRDLKPANIKVRPDGTVKVLDFGLAKALEAPRSSADAVNSPTFTAHATQQGMIVGTAAYMAPEQAKGKAVDKRADIWAFGVVFHEMLTGRRLFASDGATETLAAVLRGEIVLADLPSDTPVAVRRLIARCLERDPTLRLRDIGEARVVLAHAKPDAADAEATRRIRSGRLSPLAWLGVGFAAGAGLWLWSSGRRASTPADAPPSFTLRQLTELPGAELSPAMSPDGRQILYTSAASGNQDIYLLRAGGGRAINLTAASKAGDGAAAFSPDGERIAFRSEREGGGLFVMGATGESVRRVTRTGFDPAWSPDGRLLAFATERVFDPYARSIRSELWTVDLASGKTVRLLEGDAVQPVWSPNGRRIAYWANTGGQRDIWTVDATGGTPSPVTTDAPTDWSPEWSPDARWLYFSSDRGGSLNLWRVAIDQETGTPSGAPQAVTSGVRSVAYGRFSHDGTRMAMMAFDRTFDLSLYAYDPSRPETVSPRTTLRSPSLGWCAPSNDGTWLACSSRTGQEDLVLLRPDGSETRRLTEDVFKDRIPRWSPDGGSIAFMSTRSGEWEQWAIAPDGSNLRQLTDLHADLGEGAWSPDGRRMASTQSTRPPYGLWLFDTSAIATRATATFVDLAGKRMADLAWSGQMLAGNLRDASGTPYAFGVWDLASRALRSFEMPLLVDMRVSAIPGRPQFLADTVGGVALVDPQAGRWRVIVAAVPPHRHMLSADGRTLLVERDLLEADVWLMELKK